VLQFFLKHLSGPGKPSLDGIQGTIQGICDFLVLQPLGLAKGQDGPVILGDRGEDFISQILTFQGGKSGTRRGKKSLDPVSLGFHQGFKGHSAAAVSFTKDIQAMVGGDTVKPGRKGGVSLEFPQVVVGLRENILGRFLGLRAVMEHGKAIAQHLLVVEAHQLAVPFHIALEDDFNQFQVVNGFLRGDSSSF
jgi:hypothetical protein